MEMERPQTTTNQATASTQNTETITEAEAKTIVFNHAGVSESEISHLKVKKEYDDGRWEYEIEFYHGQWEYEYEINATTGAIIDFSKEMD